MKKFKLIFLLILLTLLTIMLTSCPIVPHAFGWDISTVYCDVTYINGNTIKTSVGQGVGCFDLIGIHNEITYIDFFEDGTLIFKPLGAEEINGTYKCKNNGIEYTTIYITLENGDNIEALGVGGYFEDILRFEYKDVEYEFSADLRDVDICEDKEEFNEQLRELAKELRYYEKNAQRYGFFNPCTVVLDENGGATLISEDEETDLYTENLRIVAVRVTDNNEVVYLDAIEEGECYFYSQLTYPYESLHYVNLYYFDPLPDYKPENPEPFTIFELIPELEAYYEDGAIENINIKMSNELMNFPIGYSNYYNHIIDKENIENILSLLASMTLWDYGPPDDNYLNNPYSIDSITLIDVTGALPEITISNYYDRIKIGDTYYYHNTDEFPKFIYAGAFQKFICNDYNAAVYKNEELLGNTNVLENIEYIVDPSQDYDYTSLHDTRTLVAEFGELTVYDATHFRYKGQFYLVVGETTFEELFQMEQ